jgi:hypothetical protein
MIEIFLTAYDPSDLPGTSIDPLGFERGYLHLADRILPGITNVASYPRYIAVLCAGLSLSDGSAPTASSREALKFRQEILLRFERFWALANVLAKPSDSNAVRGVTYAQAHIAEIQRAGASRTSSKYPLLSRQGPYGVVGIYGNVAEGMRFINRAELILTPALGAIVGDAFLRDTAFPGSLRRAVLDDADVPISTLQAWGHVAHVEAEMGKTEAQCLSDALHSNSVRSRTLKVLRTNSCKGASDTELARLSRISDRLNNNAVNRDLQQAIQCILGFEACYRAAMLGFERLLWTCRQHAASRVSFAVLRSDSVLETSLKSIRKAAKQLEKALEDAVTPPLSLEMQPLSDVAKFLYSSATVNGIDEFIRAVIARHTDVQHGKFDRGRRKMGWIEATDDHVCLTMTRVGGLAREVTTVEAIAPHPYRLRSADAFNAASQKAGSE